MMKNKLKKYNMIKTSLQIKKICILKLKWIQKFKIKRLKIDNRKQKRVNALHKRIKKKLVKMII